MHGDDAAAVARQVALANQIAGAIIAIAPDVSNDAGLVAETQDLLRAIAASPEVPGPVRFPTRPEVPLSVSALLVNGRDQPRIGVEVQKELASADRVDLLCAFVKWYGVRVLDEHIESFIRRGGRMRVITTSYIGATDRRALDRLAELGAEVKVSYETRMTRLHAKAWLFHRETGFSTAYVGSSNLSKSALIDGLEWNVRLSTVEQGHLLDTFRATFDEYWEDAAFESYDPADPAQHARLDKALTVERGGPAELLLEIATLEVRPWGYQREILDELAVERQVHGHHRNLVVMATGTGRPLSPGSTIGASGRLARSTPCSSSHTGKRSSGRASPCSDTSCGTAPSASGSWQASAQTEWRHVFASVQSLARLDLDRDLAPDRFDMVIVDEFHHASEETKTYARLLHHITPKVLVGLTATPERADGDLAKILKDAEREARARLYRTLGLQQLLDPVGTG